MKLILIAILFMLTACGPEKKPTPTEATTVEVPTVVTPPVSKLPLCFVKGFIKGDSVTLVLNDDCPRHVVVPYRFTVNSVETDVKGAYLSKEMQPKAVWKWFDGLRIQYQYEGQWLPAVVN